MIKITIMSRDGGCEGGAEGGSQRAGGSLSLNPAVGLLVRKIRLPKDIDHSCVTSL
jgi:hypothetical protein